MSNLSSIEQLRENLKSFLGDKVESIEESCSQLTLTVNKEHWYATCQILRDEEELCFEQLSDLCGVDYSEYARSDWTTEDATGSGFGRAVSQANSANETWTKPRFAVVIHLISYTNNWRLRVKTFVEDQAPIIVPSITTIWSSANWFEREAFDLFGILFEGHEDLRRILTDYGFVGHPFRKDFPLIGHVEMRYDAAQKRCVYEPVSIEPRVLVPRVVREDQRFEQNGVSK
ncbi:MAG: NADH-quinone oxidoreductase subunit C [Pseudomonadota bacterium]